MNFDDPRITAYALGELDSAEDRAAVEELLRDCPELAGELDETCAVADLLRKELRKEKSEALTTAQREQVLAAALPAHVNGKTLPKMGRAPEKVIVLPWWRRHWVPSAIAATIVLSTSISMLWKLQQPPLFPLRQSTRSHDDQAGLTASAPAPARPENQEFAGATSAPLESRMEIAVPFGALRDQQAPEPPPEASAPSHESNEILSGAKLKSVQDPEKPQAQRPASAPLSDNVAPELGQAVTRNSGTTAGIAKAELAPARATPVAEAVNYPTLAVTPQVTKSSRTAELSNIPATEATQSDAGRRRIRVVRNPSATDEARGWHYFRSPRTATSDTVELELAPLDPQPAERLGRYSLDSDHLAPTEPFNTESYDAVTDNDFLSVRDNPLSTFSIDVDTASYANVRRFLTSNQRPPKGAVRIEELVNYFPYSYPEPQGDDPFSCTMEVAPSPWKPEHRLVRVGLKGRDIANEKLPPSNLVFLLDVSGSMDTPNKLPLVKECMEELLKKLREQDTVGIVVYAGSSGVVLEPTNDKAAIRTALQQLKADGSTNGAAGIQAAYGLAQRAFKKDGNNRVILATDGDFNVGVTSESELTDLIQQKANSGVFLSVLGFGMGNVKDSTMEKLADKGNGNYAYIDSLKEGRKVLVEQMAGTLFTIAKDVKIQVEFNPAQVSAYRLIGYENRLLAKEEFNDDKKDAGEIGAGHTVTALYEIVPVGAPSPVTTTVDPLKYQQNNSASTPVLGRLAKEMSGKSNAAAELLTLKIRFKQPTGDTSVLREFPLTDEGKTLANSSEDFRWAAAVAGCGMLLRDSPHRGNLTWNTVAELASHAKGGDPGGYRTEFITLIDDARRIVPVTAPPEKEETKAGKAASLIVPEFDVTDVPVLDAIDQLSRKSRELDPEKKGVSLVIAGMNNAAQMKISLRMRSTSVLETAKAIAGTLGLKLQEQGDILIFRAE